MLCFQPFNAVIDRFECLRFVAEGRSDMLPGSQPSDSLHNRLVVIGNGLWYVIVRSVLPLGVGRVQIDRVICAGRYIENVANAHLMFNLVRKQRPWCQEELSFRL